MRVTKYACRREAEKAGGGKKTGLLVVRVGVQGVWHVSIAKPWGYAG